MVGPTTKNRRPCSESNGLLHRIRTAFENRSSATRDHRSHAASETQYRGRIWRLPLLNGLAILTSFTSSALRFQMT